MKNKIVLFVTGCCVLLLSSCLNSDENTITELAPNCQIVSFTLKADSISFDGVKFTIDQRGGRIFNSDSLPVGTKVGKVVCTLGYMNSYAVYGVQVQQNAVADTLSWWNGTDSLDFSQPVRFKVHAYDGLTTKIYDAQVNVHRQVPDSMVWDLYSTLPVAEAVREQKVMVYGEGEEEAYYMYVQPAASEGYQLYAASTGAVKEWASLPLTGLPAAHVRLSQMTEYSGQFFVPTTTGALYASADGQNWKQVENTPSVSYLLGAVKAGQNQASALCGMIDQEGSLYFASMNETMEWTSGDPVPAGFPVSGFGVSNYAAMYHEYLMVVAGRDKENTLVNTSWATMDGRRWAMLSNPLGNVPFNEREGVMVTAYDNKLFLLGGIDEKGNALKDIYTSNDFGVNWALSDTLVVMPTEYTGRGFASVQVNEEEFMYLFGGKTSTNAQELNQIWRGRINRLGFGK